MKNKLKILIVTTLAFAVSLTLHADDDKKDFVKKSDEKKGKERKVVSLLSDCLVLIKSSF